MHYLERDETGDPCPARMVKEYKRSAAGMELCIAKDLRTVETLRETVNYLLNR